MLCWIFTLGGLLIMMGQHDRSEALFYYFRQSRPQCCDRGYRQQAGQDQLGCAIERE
jgi:hypothetical protein